MHSIYETIPTKVDTQRRLRRLIWKIMFKKLVELLDGQNNIISFWIIIQWWHVADFHIHQEARAKHSHIIWIQYKNCSELLDSNKTWEAFMWDPCKFPLKKENSHVEIWTTKTRKASVQGWNQLVSDKVSPISQIKTFEIRKFLKPMSWLAIAIPYASRCRLIRLQFAKKK